MNRPSLRRALALAALSLTPSLGTQGCSEERAPISHIQPDYLDKSDLIPVEYAVLAASGTPQTITEAMLQREPIFYTQTTMISKPTTTGFVGLTSYSNMEKVRWEVTEHALIARQAYRFVRTAPGGQGGIGQNPRVGEIVAVYAISSHFDIRNDYNTSTGEPSNVVVENTTDRPWYQRQYMRVDWSRNLIDGYNSVLEYESWEGRVPADPLPVFVNTPDDPNAPVFEYRTENGHRSLRYFDVVNRALLHPETVNLGPDLPAIPVCYLGDGETACNPTEVTFRVSFLRADPTRDYEPASLTPPAPSAENPVRALDMERFGFFDVVRMGYDPQRHATLDTERFHFAARHNLFVHHHALVFASDTATGCNRDDECGGGKVCHIGNTAHDAAHRGVCGALGYHHMSGATEARCAVDDDCRTGDGAMSSTAVCDPGTRTCAEHMVRCGRNADCAGVDAQSTCDLAIAATRPDNRGLCLMPFRQRQVRPVVYHESANYPARMQPVTDSMIREWNEAFEVSVQSARRRECEVEMRVDPATTSAAENPCNTPEVLGTAPALGADGRHVMVGCHDPVWGTDPNKPGYHEQAVVQRAHDNGWDLAVCGAQGTVARLGDLRYNMIGSINDHDAQGYWGLANIAADPESGEMVSGRGAVWQTITDYYADWLVTLVRLLSGEISPSNVANGRYLIDSMRQIGSGQTPSRQVLDAPLRRPGALADLARGTAPTIERLQVPNAGWLEPHPGAHLMTRDSDDPGALDIARRRILNGRLLGDGTNAGLARMQSLRGSDLESRLMNTWQARLAPSAQPDPSGVLPATLDAASPLRGQSPALRRAIARVRNRLEAWQCNHEAAFDDDVLMGLAQRITDGTGIRLSDPDDAPVAFGRDWVFRDSSGRVDYDTVRDYATQFIHHGVLAHEIGHSLGQRHNFTASADAINYFDQYWRVRSRGHAAGIRPRYEYLADAADGHYYSAEEVTGRVEEYSYSSVMDYKGYNEDAHGIGRYDVAFIKNGYVNLVEAFRRVADQPAALTYAANASGNGLSTPLDLREWSGGGAPHGMHYSQIPAIFGRRADGTPDIGDDNRYDVFLRETETQSVPGWGDPSFTNVTTDGHLLVPYRFDSDERAGLVWQDQRYDAGADAYESLHYVASHWVDYYFANSFSRYRSGWSIGAYVDRQWGRYVEQLRQCAQTLAFDLINYQDFLANSPGWRQFRDDPREMAGFVNQAAMSEVADAMIAQVTMPEIGQHRVITRTDGTRMVAQNFETLAGFPVAINDGRAFESNWRDDAGFWWYEQLNRAGSYYDKVIALDALTDPELLLLQRDTPSDLRLFQLSFYTMYPAQSIRLFGAMLAEDVADFAPIIETAGAHEIQRTHLATLNLPPGTAAGQNGRPSDMGHAPVDPQTNFTVQLRSAIATVAQFPATFDQRYMDYARVWIDGSVESITVADPTRNTVSFDDPWSHTTIRALHFGTATGEPGADVGASALRHPSLGMAPAAEAGIGARMILRARDLDAIRLATAAGSAARQAAETQERQYLDVLHVMRRLTSYFGTGHITTQ